MKRLALLTTLALLSIHCIAGVAKQPATSQVESLDQIVAVVNDDVITRSELNKTLEVLKVQIAQENVSTPPDSTLHKQALDQLINKKLQLQIAKQAGITITDSDVDRAVSFIAKQNNMSVSDLYARINQDGMSTTDYKDEMRDQITVQKLQQQEIVSRVTISQDEINAFLHSKVWQKNSLKEYQVQDILIPLSDTPSDKEIAEAKEQAQTLVATLKQHPEVAATGKNVQSNDLGWRKLEEIPSLFAERLPNMQAHDIAGPIEAPNGIHIIRLANVRSAGAPEESAPTREQAEQILLQRKFAEAVQNWVSKQRSQAFIQTNFTV